MKAMSLKLSKSTLLALFNIGILVLTVMAFAPPPILADSQLPVQQITSDSLTPDEIATNDNVHDPDSARQEQQLAQNMATLFSRGGTMLAGSDKSNAVSGMARGMATNAAGAEIQQWLSHFGTAQVSLNTDEHFSLKNSEFDLLLPWYQSPDWVIFSQHSLHRTDDRSQMNLGGGARYFAGEWMTGLNAFYDYDLSRYHSRAGIGTEFWRDYLKLSANGYIRLSTWRSAPELNNDYEARPANGWDIRAESWLPVYPQLGGKLTYEQYYGKDVALFGEQTRQKNPHAMTAGLNWTPVPLLTFSGERRMGAGSVSESRFGIQLNWIPGMNWSQHLDPDAVRERRTLAGSRLDLVERNNNIVLEYRKKELIRLSLRERAEGTAGQIFSLVTSLQTKYPLSHIEWNAGEFLSAGGKISGSGTGTQFTLPAYRTGRSAAETVRLNTYTITAVARDTQGNTSSRAESTLIVQRSGVTIRPTDLTISSGASANGADANTVTALVTDSTGQPVSGEVVTFTLPAGVSPGGTGTTGHSTQVNVTANANGVATLNIVSLTPGMYTVTAAVRNAQAVSATTTFVQNAGAMLDLDVTVPVNNAVADGTATNTVRVVVKDSAGVVQQGEVVNFSVASGATLSASTATTDSHGIAQVTLVSTTPGESVVRVSAGGNVRTVSVTFAAAVLQGTLTPADQSIIANNTDSATLTLTITNQSGTRQPGKAVTFVSSLAGVTFTPVTDNNDGSYTVTLKGTTTGTATVSAEINHTALPGAQATVRLTTLPPLFTLTATSQEDTYTFAAESGFPTTGFARATFTVNAPSGNPQDYTWSAQTPGGGAANWLSVDANSGVVTFNSKPSSAQKSVEIVATPRAGGQPLGYRFTLSDWYVNNGGTTANFDSADSFCQARGSALPTIQQLTGSSSHVPGSTGVRGVLGGLWSEWGILSDTSYAGANFTGGQYWTSEPYSDPGTHYFVLLYNAFVNVASDDGGEASIYTVCRQGV